MFKMLCKIVCPKIQYNQKHQQKEKIPAISLSGSSYSVFEVGQVGVPPQADHVDVHDAEFGGEVVEVDCLRQRPHTQVHLWMKTEFE